MKKNFKFLGVVIISLLFAMTGCKKDSNKPLKELLISKWELQSVSYEFYENGVKTGQQVDYFGQNASVYEFLTNGSGNMYENGTLKNSFTWTLAGSSVRIEKPGEVITGEISIDNSILSLLVIETSAANGVNYEIVKLFTFKNV